MQALQGPRLPAVVRPRGLAIAHDRGPIDEEAGHSEGSAPAHGLIGRTGLDISGEPTQGQERRSALLAFCDGVNESARENISIVQAVR